MGVRQDLAGNTNSRKIKTESSGGSQYSTKYQVVFAGRETEGVELTSYLVWNILWKYGPGPTSHHGSPPPHHSNPRSLIAAIKKTNTIFPTISLSRRMGLWKYIFIFDGMKCHQLCTVFFLLKQPGIKGTVATVWSRLKVVRINTVESGEVPLVVYRFFVSSVNI